MSPLPFHVSTLVFLRNRESQLLLVRRAKAPNLNKWSPVGGKLDFSSGESPYECAVRETFEETGLHISEKDLRLFAYVSEKNYEGSGHWLMFLFDCIVPLPALPSSGPEGNFGFFAREEVAGLPIPETDHLLVWPLYDKRHEGFTALRADCVGSNSPKIFKEGEILSRQVL